MTLIELMVVIVLLTACLFFVIQFNQDIILKNKRTVVENQIMNAVRYSRNSALVTGHDVTLNPLAGGQDWSTGMILFVDNKTHHYTGQEKVVYSWQWAEVAPLKVSWNGFKAQDYLIFSRDLRHATVNGHFSIMNKGTEIRRIVLNRLGRVTAG